MARDRILAGVLAAAAFVLPASAQPAASTPAASTAADAVSYRAVTTEKAALRCGEGDFFYKVGEIAAGVTLRVDGESGVWARVAYPAGVNVYVKAEEVDVQSGVAKLTKPSRLQATNLASPGTSWKMLMATPLPEGTTLKVVGPLRDGTDGPIVGYFVTPPEQARAFIEARVLKKVAETEPVKPAPTTPPTPAPAAQPAEQPDGAKPVNLTDPMVKPVEGAPVTINQTPTAAPTVPVAPPASMPSPREVADWTALDRSFKTVWRQPLLEAELDELLAEYERALEKADANDERLQAQIQRRIDALQLRIDVRNTMRDQAEARAALDRSHDQVKEQLSLAEQARVYTIVGQLQPSTVYDGQKLPLMYRIVSVGGATTKTLGYLKDDPQFQLKARIGAVLGVIGEAELDRSLMLNIVSPVRVDTLRPAGEAGGLPPSPPTAAPAPSFVAPAPAIELDSDGG